jgi:hypothetical protein
MPAKRCKKNAHFGLCDDWPEKHRKTNVGAGLLANAVGQATLMSTDTASSRASPLPQLICVVSGGF